MSLTCPSCQDKYLTSYDFHHEEVDSCESCGGIWFDNGELNGALSTADNDEDNASVEQNLGTHIKQSPRQCAHCECHLDSYHLMDGYEIEVDVCTSCSGVWIDHGQLHKVIESPRIKEALAYLNKKINTKTWVFQFLSQMPVEYNIKPKNKPWVTYTLVLLNVLIFLLYHFNIVTTEHVFENFSLRSDRVIQGASFWTLLSHMYLHGGIMHLVGNMYFLAIIGDNLEDALGKVKFLGIYTLCGLGAAGFQIAADPQSSIPMVGASGAIAGLFAMYLLWFRHASLSLMIIVYQKKVSPQIFFAIWLLINIAGVALSDGSGGVAYWAHIGGFIVGLIVAFSYKNAVMRNNPLLQLLNSDEVKIKR
jgi:membrane associated rhomboid family serine protease